MKSVLFALLAILALLPVVSAIGMVMPRDLGMTQIVTIGTNAQMNFTLKGDNESKYVTFFAISSSDALHINGHTDYEPSWTVAPNASIPVSLELSGLTPQSGIVVKYGYKYSGSNNGTVAIDQIDQHTFIVNVVCPAAGCPSTSSSTGSTASSGYTPSSSASSGGSGGGGGGGFTPLTISPDVGAVNNSSVQDNSSAAENVTNVSVAPAIIANTPNLPAIIPDVVTAAKGGKFLVELVLGMFMVSLVFGAGALTIWKGLEA